MGTAMGRGAKIINSIWELQWEWEIINSIWTLHWGMDTKIIDSILGINLKGGG